VLDFAPPAAFRFHAASRQRPTALAAGTLLTVADLIRELAFEGKRIAVEERQIVPRSRYAEVARCGRRPHRDRRRRGRLTRIS
jgi:sulfur carrier protein ThiS